MLFIFSSSRNSVIKRDTMWTKIEIGFLVVIFMLMSVVHCTFGPYYHWVHTETFAHSCPGGGFSQIRCQQGSKYNECGPGFACVLQNPLLPFEPNIYGTGVCCPAPKKLIKVPPHCPKGTIQGPYCKVTSYKYKKYNSFRTRCPNGYVCDNGVCCKVIKRQKPHNQHSFRCPNGSIQGRRCDLNHPCEKGHMCFKGVCCSYPKMNPKCPVHHFPLEGPSCSRDKTCPGNAICLNFICCQPVIRQNIIPSLPPILSMHPSVLPTIGPTLPPTRPPHSNEQISVHPSHPPMTNPPIRIRPTNPPPSGQPPMFPEIPVGVRSCPRGYTRTSETCDHLLGCSGLSECISGQCCRSDSMVNGVCPVGSHPVPGITCGPFSPCIPGSTCVRHVCCETAAPPSKAPPTREFFIPPPAQPSLPPQLIGTPSPPPIPQFNIAPPTTPLIYIPMLPIQDFPSSTPRLNVPLSPTIIPPLIDFHIDHNFPPFVIPTSPPAVPPSFLPPLSTTKYPRLPPPSRIPQLPTAFPTNIPFYPTTPTKPTNKQAPIVLTQPPPAIPTQPHIPQKLPTNPPFVPSQPPVTLPPLRIPLVTNPTTPPIPSTLPPIILPPKPREFVPQVPFHTDPPTPPPQIPSTPPPTIVTQANPPSPIIHDPVPNIPDLKQPTLPPFFPVTPPPLVQQPPITLPPPFIPTEPTLVPEPQKPIQTQTDIPPIATPPYVPNPPTFTNPPIVPTFPNFSTDIPVFPAKSIDPTLPPIPIPQQPAVTVTNPPTFTLNISDFIPPLSPNLLPGPLPTVPELMPPIYDPVPTTVPPQLPKTTAPPLVTVPSLPNTTPYWPIPTNPQTLPPLLNTTEPPIVVETMVPISKQTTPISNELISTNYNQPQTTVLVPYTTTIKALPEGTLPTMSKTVTTQVPKLATVPTTLFSVETTTYTAKGSPPPILPPSTPGTFSPVNITLPPIYLFSSTKPWWSNTASTTIQSPNFPLSTLPPNKPTSSEIPIVTATPTQPFDYQTSTSNTFVTTTEPTLPSGTTKAIYYTEPPVTVRPPTGPIPIPTCPPGNISIPGLSCNDVYMCPAGSKCNGGICCLPAETVKVPACPVDFLRNAPCPLVPEKDQCTVNEDCGPFMVCCLTSCDRRVCRPIVSPKPIIPR